MRVTRVGTCGVHPPCNRQVDVSSWWQAALSEKYLWSERHVAQIWGGERRQALQAGVSRQRRVVANRVEVWV